MLLLAALGLLATASAQDDGATVLAVTRSGASIEGVAGTAVGAHSVDTAFGSYDAAHDPVAKVLDPSRSRARIDALGGASPGSALWVEAAAGAGMLQQLVAGADAVFASEPGRLDLFQALESWGALLDPVPGGLALGERPAWLWAHLRRASPARATLLSGRLRGELPSDDNSDRTRSLSIAELAQGMRARQPYMRRAAARMAARQHEYELLARLLELSVEDPVHAVREAASEGAAAAHQNEARAFWTQVAARGSDEVRRHAAEALGRHGGQLGVEPLIHLLASWGHDTGRRFEFAGRSLQVVRDHDRGLPLGRVGHSAFVDELIDRSSTFKIARLLPEDRDALLGALELWAGETTGRDVPQWLAWYEKRGKPEAD